MSVALEILKSSGCTLARFCGDKKSRQEWVQGFNAGLVSEAKSNLRYYLRRMPRRQQKEVGRCIREEIQRRKTPSKL